MVNGNLGYSYYQQNYNQPQQNYSGSQYQNQQNGYYQNTQQTNQVSAPIIPPKLIDYVQGELGATIYPVAYGQEVFLLDMDDPNRAYRKTRDQNGKVSPLEKLLIVQDEEKKTSEVNLKDYVKADDILDIVAEAVQAEVEKKLSEISFKPTASENKLFKKGGDK